LCRAASIESKVLSGRPWQGANFPPTLACRQGIWDRRAAIKASDPANGRQPSSTAVFQVSHFLLESRADLPGRPSTALETPSSASRRPVPRVGPQKPRSVVFGGSGGSVAGRGPLKKCGFSARMRHNVLHLRPKKHQPTGSAFDLLAAVAIPPRPRPGAILNSRRRYELRLTKPILPPDAPAPTWKATPRRRERGRRLSASQGVLLSQSFRSKGFLSAQRAPPTATSVFSSGDPPKRTPPGQERHTSRHCPFAVVCRPNRQPFAGFSFSTAR